ncbi:5698_t:CDS:2, partial [Gigaspora rosea]
DYKSQMNLINNEITDIPAFFTALSRVYDYYKSGKKRKENRFKKNKFAIVPLRNIKCYNCGRKGHLMSDCRSKKQDKGYNKEKKFSKERFSKDRSRKEFNKKGNGYKDKRGRTWKSREDYKKWKESKKKKTHPSLIEPKKKDSRKKYKDKKMWCDHCKTDTHFTNSCYKYRKDVEEVEDPMVFNLEKSREKEDFDEYIRFTKFREQYHLENEYSSSDEESQSYQEPEQYELSSDSSESDEYE